MEWDAEQIRSLRRRLGWSHADLARRLGVQVESIHQWEKGEAVPQEVTNDLEVIFNQAEVAAVEISQLTQVESTLVKRELESIDNESLDSDP